MVSCFSFFFEVKSETNNNEEKSKNDDQLNLDFSKENFIVRFNDIVICFIILVIGYIVSFIVLFIEFKININN